MSTPNPVDQVENTADKDQDEKEPRRVEDLRTALARLDPTVRYIIVMFSPRSTSKTTNSLWLLQALFDAGADVRGFDADKSGHLAAEAENRPYDVIPAATEQAHLMIPAMVPPGGFGVVDLGHIEDHLQLGLIVAKVATVMILNCAPTMSDVRRVERLPMRTLSSEPSKPGFLNATTAVRDDGLEVPNAVLLTRCPPNSPEDTDDFREDLKDSGYKVLKTTVPAHRRYIQTGAGMPMETKLGTLQQCRQANMMVELINNKMLPNRGTA